MNDDLKLILGCYAKGYGLTHIVITIPHGLNDEFWSENHIYYGQQEVLQAYKELIPLHCQDLVQEILFIEEVFEIC